MTTICYYINTHTHASVLQKHTHRDASSGEARPRRWCRRLAAGADVAVVDGLVDGHAGGAGPTRAAGKNEKPRAWRGAGRASSWAMRARSASISALRSAASAVAASEAASASAVTAASAAATASAMAASEAAAASAIAGLASAATAIATASGGALSVGRAAAATRG
ncbi:hypothetical protein M885DRAFT_517992 [Pelagophyceae sp. CCMP2097]|nr:hypothetical protein M885DRAFT_517992 [Pelagophyceae sp. CCMP2097]